MSFWEAVVQIKYKITAPGGVSELNMEVAMSLVTVNGSELATAKTQFKIKCATNPTTSGSTRPVTSSKGTVALCCAHNAHLALSLSPPSKAREHHPKHHGLDLSVLRTAVLLLLWRCSWNYVMIMKKTLVCTFLPLFLILLSTTWVCLRIVLT